MDAQFNWFAPCKLSQLFLLFLIISTFFSAFASHHESWWIYHYWIISTLSVGCVSSCNNVTWCPWRVLNPMENSILLSYENYNNVEMLWDSFWCELYRISHKRRKEQLSGFILTLPQQSRNYWFFSDFLIRDWMWRAFFFSQYFIYLFSTHFSSPSRA